jgi:poly [ADP-ribose] polymerase
MIVKENGLRYAKLIHVSVDNGMTANSNKVYIMEELTDGRIKCEYGRVGKSLVTEYKPSSKWDSVLKQKLSKTKGYTDVTDLLAEPVIDESKPTDNKVDNIKDEIVRKLIDELMSFANKSIQRNYKVSQEVVSEQQVTAAQEIISNISGLIQIGVDIKHINDMLLKLYTIIPRRMDNVKDHLFRDISNDVTLTNAQRLLDNEQSALDTMAGQVELIKQQREADKKAAEAEEKGVEEVVEEVTILDQMGLSVEVENDTETLELINKLMGPNVNQLKRVFKVVNNKTQKVFDKHMDKVEVKKKRLYWHGSRNENWFNILQTGLLIRPSGAVHTGSMFGDGIYFADKAQKSIGYSSLRGSYWAHGGDNKAFLALFDVHLGKQKEILHHDSSCYKLSKKVLDNEGFDSVFAKGGADLRNNEYIVYNAAQCTVSHLIEIGN